LAWRIATRKEKQRGMKWERRDLKGREGVYVGSLGPLLGESEDRSPIIHRERGKRTTDNVASIVSSTEEVGRIQRKKFEEMKIRKVCRSGNA